MNLQTMLERDEGRRSEAYPDPLTLGPPWTIGIGHTGPEVHLGLHWTDAQIDAAFHADVLSATDKAFSACRDFGFELSSLSEPRQAVLIAMAFQLKGGLAGFPKMMAAVRDERFEIAASQIRSSKWYTQTTKRAERMAVQLATGEWQ